MSVVVSASSSEELRSGLRSARLSVSKNTRGGAADRPAASGAWVVVNTVRQLDVKCELQPPAFGVGILPSSPASKLAAIWSNSVAVLLTLAVGKARRWPR